MKRRRRCALSLLNCWLFFAASKRGFNPIHRLREGLLAAWGRSFPCTLLREEPSDENSAGWMNGPRRLHQFMIEKHSLNRNERRFLREAILMRCMALFLFLVVSSFPIQAQVRVWEGILDLPAYEEGAPDPNPSFDQFAIGRFSYPYTLRKQITDQRSEHLWRAIYLENEYLKCSVLPDLGGHIYTCIDKISGQPMFYANPSIKKARIGYRGAWAAFGIEFNFPVSHNWVSLSPVDFALSRSPDGSASIWVANVDRVYGLQWRVELRLRPGSALLEQHVALYNPGPVRRRFYWWNNAGVRVHDDSRIAYPMRNTASHGFREVDTWPVDSKGVDLSIVGNHLYG